MTDEHYIPRIEYGMLDFDADDIKVNQGQAISLAQKQQIMAGWRERHVANRLVMLICVACVVLFGGAQMWSLTAFFLALGLLTIRRYRSKRHQLDRILANSDITVVEGIVKILEQGNRFTVIEVGHHARFKVNQPMMKHQLEGALARFYVLQLPPFILSVQRI